MMLTSLNQEVENKRVAGWIKRWRAALPMGLAALILMAAPCALSAPLGDVRLESFLGEPLSVRIGLDDSHDPGAQAGDDALISLASPQAYRAQGIEPPELLDALRLESQGQGREVALSTSRPVTTPYLDLLLDVAGEQHRVTLLIDPPPADRATALGAASSEANALGDFSDPQTQRLESALAQSRARATELKAARDQLAQRLVARNATIAKLNLALTAQTAPLEKEKDTQSVKTDTASASNTSLNGEPLYPDRLMALAEQHRLALAGLALGLALGLVVLMRRRRLREWQRLEPDTGPTSREQVADGAHAHHLQAVVEPPQRYESVEESLDEASIDEAPIDEALREHAPAGQATVTKAPSESGTVSAPPTDSAATMPLDTNEGKSHAAEEAALDASVLTSPEEITSMPATSTATSTAADTTPAADDGAGLETPTRDQDVIDYEPPELDRGHRLSEVSEATPSLDQPAVDFPVDPPPSAEQTGESEPPPEVDSRQWSVEEVAFPSRDRDNTSP